MVSQRNEVKVLTQAEAEEKDSPLFTSDKKKEEHPGTLGR